MTHLPARPWVARGRAGSLRRVTWLWTLLIVIGLAMIVVAVWPSIRKGKDKNDNDGRDGRKQEGV